MMLHSFFKHLPSLAGVLLLEDVVQLRVVVVCRGLGEVVVRPSLALLRQRRSVAEKQRRAIQCLIPEIASGRAPAATRWPMG